MQEFLTANFMMLAQTLSNENAIWAGATAFTLMLAGQLAGFFSTFLRDRRERESAARQDNYLKDIADTNREAAKSLKDVSDNQIKAGAKVEAAIRVSDIRHEEVIRAINGTCKHQPMKQ